MKQVLSVLALAAAAGLAGPAFAQTYKATASGPAESPPNGSPGTSIVALEVSSTSLMVSMPFRDLTGTTTAAHVHCCTTDAFTGVAPVALPFDDFPTGARAGDYSMAIPLYEDASYDPAFLAAHGGNASGAASALLEGMNANQAYINIHTSEYPNGEIRGFVVSAPVPEPAEWALLAGGLAGLLWFGRRPRLVVGWQR